MAVSLGYRNVFRDPYGFPKWQEQGLPIQSGSAAGAEFDRMGDASARGRALEGWGMLWTLLGVFFGGLALNLTPCVYPMIPITVSFFGGRTARDTPGQIQLIIHGLCYLLGLALTNSTLGVVAALGGGLMGALLQNPVVLIAVAAFMVIFAASLFGLWEVRLPSALTQVAVKSRTGYIGSLFMGLTLGVVAAPCIGPFVLGLLTWVAGMGDVGLGFLVFFVLSLGLGLPLFLLALFSGQLQRLPRAGGWMIWVRKLMGWALVGMAVYFIRPLLPDAIKPFMSAAVALAAGVHVGWVDRSHAVSQAFAWIRHAVGIAGISLAAFWVAAWVLRGPGIAWQPYSEMILPQTAAQGKPVIVDFSAEWCAPCRELDEVTFRHPDVVQAARRNFVMIKVDLTRGGNPLYDELLAAYGVKGVPTVVFLDARGVENTDLRMVDFLPPEELLRRMAGLMTPIPDGKGEK